jgi:pimeloyl-ACP methyl ester carboxylesterase
MELCAGLEIGAGLAARPWLDFAPRGRDGHAVLVLPGLLAGDGSTQLLRDFLGGRGYRASGWGLGRNFGPRPGVEAAMLDTLDRLSDESGGTVSIVGWSLGGIYARVLATRRPEAVRSVITLGSPISHPGSTTLSRVYEFTSGRRANDAEHSRVYGPTPPVPTTSIYSRTDGIVPWQCSVEAEGPTSENIEVHASHIGLGFNPAVHYAIGDRLAQPEGEWKRFERVGWRSVVYPDPARVEGEEMM